MVGWADCITDMPPLLEDNIASDEYLNAVYAERKGLSCRRAGCFCKFPRFEPTKQKRDAQRRQTLAELTRLGEDMGDYD
jgi:hypothetical protein